MLSKASLWDNAKGKELFREVKSYAFKQRWFKELQTNATIRD